LACSTFFEYGCTAAGRKEIVNEAVENAKTYFVEKILPEWKEKAADYAIKKLEDKEKEELGKLDIELAKFPAEDGSVKTWKDFDGDRDGHLDAGELTSIGKFVAGHTAEKTAKGEMSKDEAGRTVKNTGITIAALGAIMLALRGAKSLKKKAGPADPGTAPPAPPSSP
jgi:hypothetical protein